MIYKKILKNIRGFTKSTDLVIRTKKLIKKSRETVPLRTLDTMWWPMGGLWNKEGMKWCARRDVNVCWMCCK
jgi:hypothetical protein